MARSAGLSLSENVPFHDALYVALAELLDEPLVTLDVRLATAPGISARVVVVSSWTTR